MLSWLLVQYNPDGTTIAQQTPYSIEQNALGRQPFSYVELHLDYCANVAGIAPCTAAETGDAKCYNTLASCNDEPNFNRTTKIYRYCSPNGGRVPTGLDAIPCLRSISMTPAEIVAGSGLGLRAACSVTLQDFPHSDIRIDPYVSERSYIPLDRGTYFGKLKARNPFYNGRIMRVYHGYLEADGSYNPALFTSRTYVIEQWDGIDPSGLTRISAKDILKLATDDRATCPRASLGKITLDMTDSVTSLTLTPLGVGASYGASGYIRIGSELLWFTRSGDVLTVTRGQRGTKAATHTQGDSVQLCVEYNASRVQDIVYSLLTTYANVSSAYIDKPAWDLEQSGYLPRLYSALITTPTGVSKLLSELCEQVGVFIFWDEETEEIRFQTIRPNAPTEVVHSLSSEYHLIADSLKTQDIAGDRVNEAWIYYGIADPTKSSTDETNYLSLYVHSNTADQAQNRNNDVRIKKITSRWITDKTAAIEIATRYLDRFKQAPLQANFALDAKDANIKLCDFVEVTSKQNQGLDGSPQAVLLQVVRRIEQATGTSWAFTARQFAFGGITFNNRRIYIDGTFPTELFDLDLKAAHDARYDPSTLKSGDIVEVTIESGILVSASSTANYAITNPNTWPAGVVVILIIKGIVAGRGGDGGRGGRAFYHNGTAYIGGTTSNPSSPVHGKNGGRAILTQYPIVMQNEGIISVGGGGGGASGGAVAKHWPNVSEIAQSGGGGGGGWPYGAGGLMGEVIIDDSIREDFSAPMPPPNTHQVGNVGQSGGGVIPNIASGGAGRGIFPYGSSYDLSYPHVVTYDAGAGGCPVLYTYSEGGGGASARGYSTTAFAGEGGNGGNEGDYAVVGMAFISWGNIGTIFGVIS